MKRTVIGITIASMLGVITARVGGEAKDHPFINHSDTGETLHVLPGPASIRSPHDTQPTIAPNVPGLSSYAPSYGSGNLVNHGGHQIPNAGFFAIYWNAAVADAGGAGVAWSGQTVRSQLTGFAAAFSDGNNYSQGNAAADYSIVQQYGRRDAISGNALSLGFYVDNELTSSSIKDSDIRKYIAGLLNSGTIPLNPNAIYGVYFPPGMKIMLQGGTSCTSFCGYHGHFLLSNGMDIKYASFPFTNCRACSLSGLTVADMLTIVTSHEIREAVTDPDLDAWYDAAGYEADDKCAWHNLYRTVNGGYWVQPEFSNGGTVTDASGFTASYPSLSVGKGACIVAK